MTDTPKFDERYANARNSRNLTVVSSDMPHRDTDYLAAAAWSKSRIGHALLQLHSEWDSSEKPIRPTKEQATKIAETLDRIEVSNAQRLDMVAGWEMANRWYMHEVGILLAKLKTLPKIREALNQQAQSWKWDDPMLSAEILQWWLDQTCRVCHGTRWQLIAGTNRLSNRPCHGCHGSGIREVPHGQQGRKMANFMDDCVNVSRAGIRKALQRWNHAV